MREIPVDHDGPKSRHAVGGECVCTRSTSTNGSIPICIFYTISSCFAPSEYPKQRVFDPLVYDARSAALSTDPEVRQYAARALEMEVQQSAYHGYAPPTQWSQSQYTAPVESYSQYSHGGNYGHGQSTSIQQQYGYQQGSRPGFSVQSQTSQYQTLSSQTSHQVSQTHGYPSEIRAMPHPSMEQSTLDARANSKPYSQTYSAQQYGIDQSSTGSVSSGSNERHDVNRLQYQNHHGSNPRHRQASYPTSDAATYVNRPSYPSQSSAIMSYNHQGITSYSQPQSSTASYPSQPQPSSVSQSRTTQPDSYASAFLAPLASHQFAPRLSQSVSTLPRHSSDSRAVYSTNSRSVYSEGARPVYSADGRYLYSADAQGNPTTSQKPPSSSSQIPITQQPYSSQPLQRNSLSQQQTAFQTNTNPGRGHSEEAGSSNDTRVQTVYGYAPRSQSGKRHYQEQYEYHNQLQAPHSNQVKQDMHSDNHHVGNRQAHGTRRQPEGRWGTNSSELDTHNHSPGSFTHHSHQRPEQPDSATHYTASQGQPVQSLSTSQVPDEQLSEGTYAAQPHIQNNASHSAQNSDGPHTQPYSSYRYSEAHARSHVKPVSEHPPAHTIPVQQTNNVAPEQQPGVQTSQSSQAEMQTAQPTGLSTQTQTYHRDVYAPLAGRPLRGRGVGRPLYNGPPRVLQGGPQRILSIPQPTQLPQPHPRQQQGAYRPPVRQSSNASGRQVIRTPSFSPVYGEIQQLRSVPDPIPGGPNSNISSDTAQETPGTAEPSYTEASGDCSMEDANATARLPETGATNELQVIIQETTTSHPNTPPPPYEPLAKDRARLHSGSVPEQASGQGVIGYATQLQQLPLRSQQSTPQPPSERSQVTGIPQVTFQHTITRPQPARNQTLHKHSAEDSAAHFDAFLSAGASTSASQPKPNSTAPIAPIQETTGARRPTPPVRTPSASNASSTRPRLSPVVELTQRSSFITPRKDKQWREPIRDATTDTPKRLDASSPDSLSLSPMKRKRDPNVDVGSKTMKRMMSMSIQPPQTPGALGRTYDATMRTPGTSKMKLVVELPLRKPANGLSPEHSHIGTSAQKRDPHIEKLRSLIDDIIEAEDALDPEIAAESGNTNDWFSTKTSDWHAPLLAPSVMARLTQLAGRRGTRLSDVDSTNLTRILKLLGRSIVKGEDMDPFNSSIGTTAPGSAVKPKAKGKKKAKGSAEEDTEIEECKEDVELTEGDFERLGRALEVAKEAVIAADCVLAFLSTEKLPKQLYSEDLINSCLSLVKSQLSSIIYPYVETSSDVHGHSPPLLLYVAQGTSDLAVQHRKLLGDIFQTLNAVLPRITALANHGISETMVIQAVFIGIGPFFVVEVVSERASKADKKNGNRIQVLDVLGGPTSMRGLRLTALGLVRALFAAYESQRPWIVEEILGSLIKLPDMKLKAGQFKLRDGATIHVVSALLFQLVQTSAHDVRIHAQKLARKRREAIADAKTTTFVEGGKVPLLDEHDREEIHLYLNGLESATKTARTIVLFLTQRSGKNKNTKSTNEAEYRSIFDNLIQDILVVLNWPEWPAANLLMSIVCKFMLSSLEDVKSSSDTAAKNMALDHLGEIATRLRETHLTMQLPFETVVKPLEEIVANCDLKALDDLILAHSDVYAHLTKRSSDDQAYDSARELTAATWAQELASCLRQCDSILSKTEGENLEDMSDVNLPKLASKIKSALRAVWKENTTDMFDLGIDAEIKRVDDLAERFGGTQSLRNAFEPILSAIILALDAPAVFMRTKALRSLGLIVTKDSSILKQARANVRRAIENHLMDSSPQVRDAAIDLIGKYLVLSPELVDDYYPQIANRIADTGLVVRKRVIKLLKNLYGLTDNHQRRVDICTKLVLRLFDEDDGIKDLAISTIEELWFCDIPESNSGKRVNSRETGTSTSRSMTGKISVIMGVNANFRDRHSPLEDMLHEIISRKNDRDSSAIVRQYVDVCDALTDSLVDAQEIPGFSVVNCIRTVHVFTAAHPTVMSTRKAVVLLPYLKNGSTGDDHAIADYLLKIFRSCIPRMPTGTSKFGTELQQTLEPMVIKPVGMAGVAALPETVACLCAVVHHITHDYQRLVTLLRSCNSRLVQILNKPQPSPQDMATLTILAFIVSLLGEHSDFDKIRQEQSATKDSIDSIDNGPIAEYIYGLIHKLYKRFNDQQLRGRLLQCFGFLFRAHPSLMTREDSAEMMDAVFASPQEEAQARLLKIMQEFLLSEASKHTQAAASNRPKKASAVDMDELIGNTDGFADSGVSSAIIQRYLTQVLSSALSPNRHIQAPAADILSFTVRQGLAHPLQCFPIIVALETSHDNSLSSRASSLHTLLHNKHASLLNSRYLESVGKSLEYQKQLHPGTWKGYRLAPSPTALLHRWYSLVREKRQSKLDFLKSFLRVFDVDVAVLSCAQDQLDLVRYIAENMSAFDYKAQEEVLTVIRHLTHVLSVAGMHIVEILHQERRDKETVMEVDQPTETSATIDSLSRARVATVISIVLVLKAHLKHLYGITEEKASRFVPGKKTAAGDKPASARHGRPISWERVTFATRIGKTTGDVSIQEDQLLELWAEDGVTAEPDDFGD
ncbi:proline-rich protein Rad9 protein [Rhizoctonia solani]|uniref:Sister chromatid cohesion protein n=1 Tax=Rhizoctonia solani TaxID=456999 RepID=A0A8H8SX24_9AGAM|nr:proline-rich protein Rad9 protein [Rhizoctonia solani]QRW20097.1 proline-rich protein Rad9 protein [Rhizoctonia solani]